MRTARANRCVLERPNASQGQPAREHGREDFNRRACRCTMASTSCRMMDLVSGSLRAPRLSSTRCSVGPLQTSMTRCTTPAVTGVRSWCRAGDVSRAGAAVQRPVQSSGACAERACCAGCRRERACLSGVWIGFMEGVRVHHWAPQRPQACL